MRWVQHSVWLCVTLQRSLISLENISKVIQGQQKYSDRRRHTLISILLLHLHASFIKYRFIVMTLCDVSFWHTSRGANDVEKKGQYCCWAPANPQLVVTCHVKRTLLQNKNAICESAVKSPVEEKTSTPEARLLTLRDTPPPVRGCKLALAFAEESRLMINQMKVQGEVENMIFTWVMVAAPADLKPLC